MLNVMVWDGLADLDYIERHTVGFGLLKQRIHEFTPRAAEDICGVPAADIIQCAHWFGKAGSALSLYTMGLNQSSSGTAKNAGSEEHTSELQSLMRISYAVFCLKKKKCKNTTNTH